MAPDEAENKELVRAFVKTVFDGTDVGAVDEFLLEGYREHDAGTAESFESRDELKAAYAEFFAAFPDLEVAEDGCLCEGDTVVYRHTIRGTHRGEFLGVEPTGNEIRLENVAVFRIEDGKIAEGWVYPDTFTMMRQLGLVPENPITT